MKARRYVDIFADVLKTSTTIPLALKLIALPFSHKKCIFSIYMYEAFWIRAYFLFRRLTYLKLYTPENDKSQSNLTDCVMYFESL